VGRRRKGRALDGVLLLAKPAGMSSNAALQKARRLFDASKAGHTGTLDPMATGLLPLAFGEATKFCQLMLEADKVYEACIVLGAETDTGDAEGVQTATSEMRPSPAAIAHVVNSFVGNIEQIPPMYSALKRDGKPLYEYARQGVELERKARPVTIHALEVLAQTPDALSVRVRCSKGTYIRSLAMDIGRELGCGAYLGGLSRVSIGPFVLAQAVSFDDLEDRDGKARDRLLLPMDALAANLPALELSEEQAEHVLHGQCITWLGTEDAGTFRLYRIAAFLGLGTLTAARELRPRRLLATECVAASAEQA
jgi:tRNA pseudouridine55 synthase